MIAADKGEAGKGASHLVPLLALAAATLVVYAVSLANGFVWDDDFIIVKNPATLHISGIYDLLFAPDVVKPYYRPLNRASYLLNYWLTGMSPAGFHAVNVLVHLGNVLLLYLVGLRVATGKWAAFAAALLFAVHPVNSEAVNFISGRNNLLALLFVLASLLLFLRGEGKPGWRIFLAALLFFLGLLSKETGLMVIVLIGFFALYPPPAEGGRWGRLPSLLLFLVAVALYLAMRAYALHGLAGGTSPLAEGLFARVAQNYAIIPRYLGMFLFPDRLTVFHAPPGTGFFTDPVLFVAWVAIVAAVWLLVRWRNPGVLFGLSWLAVNYIPIANIVPIPSAPVAERYLYLPVAGLCLVAGEAFVFVSSRERVGRYVRSASVAVILLLAILAIRRNLDWKDDLALFASAVKSDPASVKGHFNLGNVYLQRGDLAAAEHEWQAALAIDPRYPDALTQLGTLAAVRRNFPRAEQFYLAALDVNPGNAMTHYNLGRVYELGGAPAKAAEQFELALRYMTVEYAEYTGEIEGRLARLRSMGATGGAAPAK